MAGAQALAAQNAPFVPSGAESYSAKIANLYLAVNVRRFALSGTSGSDVPFQRDHPTRVYDPGRSKQRAHLACIGPPVSWRTTKAWSDTARRS